METNYPTVGLVTVRTRVLVEGKNFAEVVVALVVGKNRRMEGRFQKKGTLPVG